MVTPMAQTVIAATITVLANGLGGLPFVFVKGLGSFRRADAFRLSVQPDYAGRG
jgi:hypothetical protein